MSKSWDALVALEALLLANLSPTTTLKDASIGLIEDMFHENKFGGNLPFAAVEWRGDSELSEGPDDSDEDPIVPFIATIVVLDKSDSSKENRRAKIETAMAHVPMIRNIVEGDLTLGGNAIDYHTKVGDSRMSDRVQPPFWAVEVDVQISVREVAGSR